MTLTPEETTAIAAKRANYISILSKLYALEVISKDAYVGELIHVAKAEGYNLNGIVIKEEFDA